ncbi:MAG: phosphotransferase [Anaerolineae bacterium]|nr:phosphotransferase [Anaerolineae bacterium]
MLGQQLALGRTAEIFAWGKGEQYVIKLPREGFTNEMIAYEAKITQQLTPLGLPMPAMIETAQVGERLGIVYERVNGQELGKQLEAKPWTLFNIARRMADLHFAIHQHAAPPELPSLRERMQREITTADLPDHLRADILASFQRLPDSDRVCHVDFHMLNVLSNATGDVVIDWISAAKGHPFADVARTYINILLWPPRKGLMDFVQRLVQYLMSTIYVRRYTQHQPAIDKQWPAWIVCSAASRLAERIAGERETLLRIIDDYEEYLEQG